LFLVGLDSGRGRRDLMMAYPGRRRWIDEAGRLHSVLAQEQGEDEHDQLPQTHYDRGSKKDYEGVSVQVSMRPGLEPGLEPA
jgi:hypothetical protein